jgi:hypothetical protein
MKSADNINVSQKNLNFVFLLFICTLEKPRNINILGFSCQQPRKREKRFWHVMFKKGKARINRFFSYPVPHSEER